MRKSRLVLLLVLAVPAALTTVFCPIGSSGLPSCGDTEATDLVKQMFAENTDYTAVTLRFIRMQGQNEQTGAYTCDGQIVDNEGDEWNVAYVISRDETDSARFIVEAEWALARVVE